MNEEHNITVQSFDHNGNMHTVKAYTLLSYLISDNHIHKEDDYKFHKAIVNGIELENIPNGNIGKNCFRDIWDFKIYCRTHCGREYIETNVPVNIIEKFLLDKNESARRSLLQKIENGAKNLDSDFNNGGGGLCEYRPGRISQYDYFSSKGVKIEWIAENGNVLFGIVTRKAIYNTIINLIARGKLVDGMIVKETIKNADMGQLQGQMSIFDFGA